MRATLLVIGALAATSAAWATSIRPTTIAERTKLSDRVVRVEVISSRTVVPEGDVRRMATITTVKVVESWKGPRAAILEIFQVGGKSGSWEAHVPDDAVFRPNERAVLFLRCRDANNPARCTLVGLKTGKLDEIAADTLLEPTPVGVPLQKRMQDVAAEVRAAEGAK